MNGQLDTVMNGQLEWEGFASLAQSGVREALFVAGVDCCAHAQPDTAEWACDRRALACVALADPE